MAAYRPAVREEDSYIEKIVKYIPAEIVAGYAAIAGCLAFDESKAIPDYYVTYYVISALLLWIITPVWIYYAVKDDVKFGSNPTANNRILFHAVISFFAYPVWVYALGNPLLKTLLCNSQYPLPENCGLYSPVLGSILLVLFTLMVPLLERIILGPGNKSRNTTAGEL